MSEEPKPLTEEMKTWLDDNLPVWGVEDPSEMTIKQLEKLTDEYARLDDLYDDTERKLKALREARDHIGVRIEACLSHNGLDKYASKRGSFDVRTRLSFTTPKTPEDKQAHFKWLQDEGVFWEVVGVNSNSLNAYAKNYWDEEKNDWKEKVPGLESPKEYSKLYFRKG